MYKPHSCSKKFIPLSTWLGEGKTFHPVVFVYLERSKTSSGHITANKVARRTPVNQHKELVFHRCPCHRHRRVLKPTEGENFRSLFTPYFAGASSCRPPQAKSHGAIVSWTHAHHVQVALASSEKHDRN